MEIFLMYIDVTVSANNILPPSFEAVMHKSDRNLKIYYRGVRVSR